MNQPTIIPRFRSPSAAAIEAEFPGKGEAAKAISEEIQILRQAANWLGRDSYCGAWLADQLPSIESALVSDYPPEAYAFSIQEARIHADKIVAQAKEEAASIEARAKAEAEKTREAACRFCDSIRQSLKRDIESALNRIERF